MDPITTTVEGVEVFRELGVKATQDNHTEEGRYSPAPTPSLVRG